MARRPNLALATLPVLAAIAAIAFGETPAEPLEIVDRAIEYHGGERYRQTATALKICSKSGCYDVEARIDDGLFSLEVSGKVSAGPRRVRVTNDEVRIWGPDGRPQPAAPDEEAKLRDWVMARVYFAFLPYRLNDPSASRTDLGLERWGDRELHKVKVTFEPGTSSDASDEFLYWFDPQSGRVEQFAYSYRGSPGGLRFRRGFNYRRIGGILFFDQQNLGIEGDGLSVDLIDPEYVERLREVSRVELREIVVESSD